MKRKYIKVTTNHCITIEDDGHCNINCNYLKQKTNDYESYKFCTLFNEKLPFDYNNSRGYIRCKQCIGWDIIEEHKFKDSN